MKLVLGAVAVWACGFLAGRAVPWLRYGPLRRHVVRFCNSLEHGSWLQERILDWLYPGNCEVTFK